MCWSYQINLNFQPASRASRQDNRQLVRTQSLGSVGTHTVDSVWPSDDNSSYDSDGHSIKDLNASSRRIKQKGWCETALDGPVPLVLPKSPLHHPSVTEEICIQTQGPMSHSHGSMSSISSPRTPKPILEIPAESNPSPMQLEKNIEMFNNNVLSDLPKNCTVVQAGQCKPYREVTKPFEMSDFYKYSTKFRHQDRNSLNESVKSPDSPMVDGKQVPKREADNGDTPEDIYQKGMYQPLQPMKCQALSPAK